MMRMKKFTNMTYLPSRLTFLFYGLCCCSMFLSSTTCFAQDDTNEQTKNEQLVPRHFSEEAIQEYKEDSDFNYNREVNTETYTIWDYINEWLRKIFGGKDGETTFKVILYGIAGIAIIFLIFQLLGISPRQVFYGNRKKATVKASVKENDIHEIDFHKEIQQAEKGENWQEAIRLNYLYSLKLLSDRDLIIWRLDKTNHEYEYEIKQAAVKNSFQQLTEVYEWVCYGDFKIEANNYTAFKGQFDQFNQQIKTNA